MKFETDIDFKTGLMRLAGGFLGFYLINLVLSTCISNILPVQAASRESRLILMALL